MVLNGSLCVILCWGKTGSDREHFQVPDSLREVKTLGSVEEWIPSDGLPQILTDFLLFSELCQHLPQKRALVWKLSTLADLPILDSFSSGQGYILFLFVSVGGGEKGGTEELLTASPCLDSSVAGSFLGFVLGEMTLLHRHLSYLGRWFSLPSAI